MEGLNRRKRLALEWFASFFKGREAGEWRPGWLARHRCRQWPSKAALAADPAHGMYAECHQAPGGERGQASGWGGGAGWPPDGLAGSSIHQQALAVPQLTSMAQAGLPSARIGRVS